MEDKNRFAIMQQVGLSQKEVKHSIHTQILTVFFLPLITAGIHVMFAYPIIRAILRAMMLSSETVFITCTVASFLVFSVLYAVVYALTAKVYYRIISEDNKSRLQNLFLQNALRIPKNRKRRALQFLFED